jgi:hypothetical protein
MGKTALLEYLRQRAAEGRVIGVTAVQSEMELAFAALHQLCAPMLDELELLPAPQRNALRITFGLDEGPAPDRFLVGLSALNPRARMPGNLWEVCDPGLTRRRCGHSLPGGRPGATFGHYSAETDSLAAASVAATS